MAFPATQQILLEGFQQARSIASRVKTRVTRVRDLSAAGPINRFEVIKLVSLLSDSNTTLSSIASISGIGQFAQDQLDDNSIDIAAEFSTMNSAIIALRDWIVNNYPTDSGSGAWLVESYNNSGNSVPLTFTTAELVTFRTHCDTLIATID